MTPPITDESWLDPVKHPKNHAVWKHTRQMIWRKVYINARQLVVSFAKAKSNPGQRFSLGTSEASSFLAKAAREGLIRPLGKGLYCKRDAELTEEDLLFASRPARHQVLLIIREAYPAALNTEMVYQKFRKKFGWGGDRSPLSIRDDLLALRDMGLIRLSHGKAAAVASRIPQELRKPTSKLADEISTEDASTTQDIDISDGVDIFS